MPLAVRLPGAGRSPACSGAAGSSGALPRTAARSPPGWCWDGVFPRCSPPLSRSPQVRGLPSSRFPALLLVESFASGSVWPGWVSSRLSSRQEDLRSGPALRQGLGRCEACGQPPAGERGQGGGTASGLVYLGSLV